MCVCVFSGFKYFLIHLVLAAVAFYSSYPSKQGQRDSSDRGWVGETQRPAVRRPTVSFHGAAQSSFKT